MKDRNQKIENEPASQKTETTNVEPSTSHTSVKASSSSSSTSMKQSRHHQQDVGAASEDMFFFSSASNSEGEEESGGSGNEESSNSPSVSSGSPHSNTTTTAATGSGVQQSASATSIHKSSTLTHSVVGSSSCTCTSSTAVPKIITTMEKTASSSSSLTTTPIQINKPVLSSGNIPMSNIAANASLTYRLLHHRLLNSSSQSLSAVNTLSGTPSQSGSGELMPGSVGDRSFSDFLGRTFATASCSYSISYYLKNYTHCVKFILSGLHNHVCDVCVI